MTTASSPRPDRAPQTAQRPAAGAVQAIRLRGRSPWVLAVVSSIGLIAFGWPLLAEPGSQAVAHAGEAPLLFAVLLPLLIAVLMAELADGRLDAKAVAMLGVLAAVGSGLRALGAGVAGIELVWIVIVLGGRVFGRGFGFVLGATTLLSSALLTGGVGPWLPFQMLGAAWVGFLAGCLPGRWRGRREVVALAVVSAISALAYGALLNLWFWPWAAGFDSSLSYVPGAPPIDNLVRWIAFGLATSLGWDLVRAVTVAGLVLVAGPSVLRALRRAARRAAFDADVTFEPAGRAQT